MNINKPGDLLLTACKTKVITQIWISPWLHVSNRKKKRSSKNVPAYSCLIIDNSPKDRWKSPCYDKTAISGVKPGWQFEKGGILASLKRISSKASTNTAKRDVHQQNGSRNRANYTQICQETGWRNGAKIACRFIEKQVSTISKIFTSNIKSKTNGTFYVATFF